MSHQGRSCGRNSNNSVTREGSTQSTFTSKTDTITLHENKEVVQHNRVRHNPYTDEYVQRKQKMRNKYVQLRLHNGEQKHDDQWVGDIMENKGMKKHVRFWMQNVHGLVQSNNIHDFQFDIATLADRNINYMTFTETCVNTSKPGYSTLIKQAYAQIVTNGQLNITNTPDFHKKTNYQPGGIASGFDGTLRSKYLRSGRDKMGRWTWDEFGDNNVTSRIYNVYRVINGSLETSGANTAWAQQQLYMETKNIEGTPRQNVIQELTREVKEYVDKGYNIIILGDFNESINSPEQLNEKMKNIGLYNLMEHHINTRDLPRTFNRGSQAIDHVFMTKHILDNTTYAGYAPFEEGYISDHRGIFFDLKEKALFPTTQSNIIHHDNNNNTTIIYIKT